MNLNQTKQNDFGEDVIDKVRDRIYEDIKNMSVSELSSYFDKKTVPIIKQFNMQVVKPTRRMGLKM
jgi:hypothetical protein